MRWFGSALTLAMLVCGCAPARFYRLTRINGVPAIAPPGFKDGDRQVTIRVAGGARGACEIRSQDFRFEGTPREAVVTVDLGTLFPDGAYDEVAHQSFEAFRVALEGLEEQQGCLPAGGARLIAARVAEALPLVFQDVTFYRNHYNPFRTWVDLEPGVRLVRQAALVDGEGELTAGGPPVMYAVVERPGSNGVRFQPLPEGASEAPHQRLFLRTKFLNALAGKPEQHSMLLAAADLRVLNDLTEKFIADPAAVCDTAPSPCSIFPHRITVVPELAVTARGRVVYVDPVSTVMDVLRRYYGKTPPRRAMETVSVERPFAGGYAKVDLKGAGPLALKLPVVAGDRIRWRE